ncbi:MAG: helix-turn-helix domain-containing protein [Leptospirales bacterium]|nr:helix-turn-helix domain-containing protein [Leptospirales bacterium]
MIDTKKYKDDELVTLREAAAILKVSISTVARYREEGKIPCFQYSQRKILYKVHDLREFLEKSYKPPCNYI